MMGSIIDSAFNGTVTPFLVGLTILTAMSGTAVFLGSREDGPLAQTS
jgi:hypothetical protein